MNRWICKHLGHKWLYSFSNLGSRMNFRVCKRCSCLERYEESFPFKAWMRTVEYTDKGARKHLGNKYN